jgi:hypothetical protein
MPAPVARQKRIGARLTSFGPIRKISNSLLPMIVLKGQHRHTGKGHIVAEPKDFEQFITTWNDSGTGYFKLGRIVLAETSSHQALEAAAKKCAKDIEGEVMYAWDLGKSESDAWWLGWGGFDLEEEIPFHAALSKPEALEKLKAFDPKDNEFECASLDEYKDILFSAYDEDLTAKDLSRGFLSWVASLEKEARLTLKDDLTSWTANAGNA